MLSRVLPPSPTPLVACELVQVQVPLRAPLRSAHGEETERRAVLVRVVDADGAEGWGECSALARPTYTHEYSDGAWQVLHDELVPAALAGAASPVSDHPMASAAIADARLDLELRRAGLGILDVLGVEPGSLERTAVVGRQLDPGRLRDVLAECVDAGVAAVKLKVTSDDAGAVLEAVRGSWPDLVLAADANGSLDEADAMAVGWDELGLSYLEQPFAAGNLLASARMATSISTPVALDESAVDADVLAVAVTLGSCSMVNVKPARLGGVAAAIEIIGHLRTWGIGWFVGGMLETGVGRSASLAVASLPGATRPTDLGPSQAYFDEDVTDPIALDAGGGVLVPGGPGACMHPRPERLTATALRREVLR